MARPALPAQRRQAVTNTTEVSKVCSSSSQNNTVRCYGKRHKSRPLFVSARRSSEVIPTFILLQVSYPCCGALVSRPIDRQPNRAQASEVIVFIRSAISAQCTHSTGRHTSINVCGESAPRLAPPVLVRLFSCSVSCPRQPQPGQRLSHPVPGTSTAIWRNESGRSDDSLHCALQSAPHTRSTQAHTDHRERNGRAGKAGVWQFSCLARCWSRAGGTLAEPPGPALSTSRKPASGRRDGHLPPSCSARGRFRRRCWPFWTRAGRSWTGRMGRRTSAFGVEITRGDL